MVEYIKHFVNTWDQNLLVVAIVSSLLTLITTLIIFFSRQIGHLISSTFKWFWATKITRGGKDYTFEKAYLNWIINQHRYLGLLPARVVAARWGEEGRNVDLEKVYVSLHVSTQRGDKNQTEIYTEDASSWRKRPWLYAMLRKTPWIYIIFTPLIILILPISFLIIYHNNIIFRLFIIVLLVILTAMTTTIRATASL